MKRPRRFEDGTAPHRHAAAKDEQRQFYFQALDSAIGELERWFNQSDLAKIQEIESVFLCSANDNPQLSFPIGSFWTLT